MDAGATAGASITLPHELSREYLLYHGVCPLGVANDGCVLVATAEKIPQHRIDAGCGDIARLYRAGIRTTPYDGQSFDQAVERITSARDTVEVEQLADRNIDTDARDLANQPPVVRYVNFLLKEAADTGASDIHIETASDFAHVRFRIDGVLERAPEPPPEMHHAVVSRLKLLAGLDIAERRKAQDGRIKARLDARAVDLRVSTVASYFGESVVIRILDDTGVPAELGALGMPADVLDEVVSAVGRSHGLVLVTGPTGSGKTTTLYGALRRRDAGREKIITVEDPVEYELPGITQVAVNRQAGITFASALRAILRQDPDVVMIGEMRDVETAEIAVQAATTGHLVLSTLHTNDAVGAIVRARDLGIPEFLLSATLTLVIAQRLVRVVCTECREQVALAPDVQSAAERLGFGGTMQMRGRGCPGCRATGYRTRTGVFEVLTMSPGIRGAVGAGATHSSIVDLAIRDGMRPLLDHAWSLVHEGVTTAEEVIRAVV